MSRNKSKLLCLALLPVLVLAGCQVRFGPVTGTSGPRNINGGNSAAVSDPAEQAAIEVVKKHGGHVTQDNNQSNNPVLGVTVFMPSFTDADLKALASLTKARKMNLASTKITGAGFKDLTGLKDLTS